MTVSTAYITAPGARPLTFTTGINKIARRPLVVFDMAFQAKDDFRKARTVSGAALWLSSSIKQSGIAIPFFLPAPLINSDPEAPIFPPMLRTEERTLIFALSLYDDLFKETQKEVQTIRQRFPSAQIIMGGPSVNSCRDLKDLASFFPGANAFVRGDGELIIVPLIEALSPSGGIDREALQKLKGIYFINSGFEHHDEHPNVSTSQILNGQPWLVHAYPSLISDIRKNGRLLLNTSRSCKYRCIFCAVNDREPIYWPAERIIQELRRIKEMVEKGSLPVEAKNITFMDNDFFQDREKTIAFLRKISEDPIINNFFTFCFQTSIASLFYRREVDAELLGLIKKTSAPLIIGTDGFNEEAIRTFRKPYTWEMARRAMVALSEREVHQGHDLILTYPAITREKLIESLQNLLLALEQYKFFCLVRLNVFTVANESNNLMGAWPGNDKAAPEDGGFPVIYSSTGVKKSLPYPVPLLDRELEGEIKAAFKAKFLPKQAYLKKLAVFLMGTHADHAELIDRLTADATDLIEKNNAALGGKGVTNYDIFKTTLPLLQMLAIMDLIDKLER